MHIHTLLTAMMSINRIEELTRKIKSGYKIKLSTSKTLQYPISSLHASHLKRVRQRHAEYLILKRTRSQASTNYSFEDKDPMKYTTEVKEHKTSIQIITQVKMDITIIQNNPFEDQSRIEEGNTCVEDDSNQPRIKENIPDTKNETENHPIPENMLIHRDEPMQTIYLESIEVICEIPCQLQLEDVISQDMGSSHDSEFEMTTNQFGKLSSESASEEGDIEDIHSFLEDNLSLFKSATKILSESE